MINEALSSPKLEGIQVENREEGKVLKEKLREAIAKLDSIPHTFAASPIKLENPSVVDAIEKKAHTLSEELHRIEEELDKKLDESEGKNPQVKEIEEKASQLEESRNKAVLAEAEAQKALADARSELQSIKGRAAEVKERYDAAAMNSGQKRQRRLDKGYKPKIDGKYETVLMEIGKARIDGKSLHWEKPGHKTKVKHRHRLPISSEYHAVLDEVARVRQKVKDLRATHDRQKAELEKIQGELSQETRGMQIIREESPSDKELKVVGNETKNVFDNAHDALDQVKRIEEMMHEFQQQASTSQESLADTQKRLLDLIQEVHIE